MNILDRIRDRWRRLVGGVAAPEADADTVERSENFGDEGYECSICGTPVDDPDGSCPLCSSTDVAPAGERTRTGTAKSDEVRAVGSDEVRVGDSSTDESADRLRELREADERDERDHDG